MLQDEIARAIQFIESDKLKQAIRLLLRLSSEKEYQNSLHLQMSRLSEAQKSFNHGLISRESFSVDRNRITFALLEMISNLEDSPNEQLQKKNQALQFYQFGNIQLNQKQYFKAILYFTKAIIADPSLINAYLERGAAKCAIASYEEAIQDLNAAINLNPTQPFAYFNRGIAYFQLGEKSKACQDWQFVSALGFDIADEYLEQACQD